VGHFPGSKIILEVFMSKSERTEQVTVKFRKRDYESLKLLSAKTHKPMAELIRNYVDRGMNTDKTKNDIDFIRTQIREELRYVMDGYMNRLIKLLIKIGTMAVSMCYFTSKLLFITYRSKFKDKADYDEMFTDAKKKAAAFLGMKDASIDEACKNILGEE